MCLWWGISDEGVREWVSVMHAKCITEALLTSTLLECITFLFKIVK